MTEFIVSWSAYGPSGRLHAESLEEAVREVETHLAAVGLHVTTETHPDFAGAFVMLRSPVKRYGDMASFGVCVYPVGGRSFYDAQRDALQSAQAVNGT